MHPAPIDERWSERGGVRLRWLAAGDDDRTPLLYVPGSLGSAEDFRGEMRRLAPRRTAALDARGLGGSDAPESGYSLEDRTADLAVVAADAAEAFGGAPLCVMAYSLGVPVALRWAVEHPESSAGLILLDYPALWPVRGEAWLEHALPFAREQGVPEHVVRALAAESVRAELWNELPRVAAPTLLIAGGSGSRLLAPAELERYRTALPRAEITVFEDAGHEVWAPDYERFMGTVERFLARLDGASPFRSL